MSDADPPQGEQGPDLPRRRADQVCDRFERAWRSIPRPRIEDYLAQLAESEQLALFRELLALELELRRTDGERPDPQDYCDRFPGHADLITAVFAEPVPKPRNTSTPQRPPAPLPGASGETTSPGPTEVVPVPAGASVRRCGDYEYDDGKVLGRGGMGIVYLAWQLTLSRNVALKMIRVGELADETDVRRFYTEAEAAANLNHSGIVPIYEFGQHDRTHYLAMGFMEGQSLAERLREGPLSSREAAGFMVKVGEAIEYAHQHGVIHRDLKPANILLDQSGNPKVADFGLAKKLERESSLTGESEILGTPSYMPPEQARGGGKDVGPMADVYSLGATLYALVTGRPPFQAATAMETVLQVLRQEPVPPRGLNASIPRDLETICLKCLRKEPDRRYPSAKSFAEDLTRFLSREPILARRTGLWERAYKFTRREPAIASLLLLVALILVGSVVSGYVYQQSRLLWYIQRQERTHVLTEKAERAAEPAELVRAESELSNYIAPLRRLPRLHEALSRAEEALQAVRGRLERIRMEERIKAESATSQRKLERFRRLRSDAFFQNNAFTWLELPSNSTASNAAEREAIELYAESGSRSGWKLTTNSASLKEHEGEIREGCLELLVLLSFAETTQARRLKRLDEAMALGIETRACSLYRAECLTSLGRLREADAERSRADRVPLTTAFDHFLIGQIECKRGNLEKGIQHFNTAIRLQPAHFWARCQSAICLLQLRRTAECVDRLNSCLQEPNYQIGWLYLLRGLAFSMIGEAAKNDATANSGVLRRELRNQADVQFAAAAEDFERAEKLLDSSSRVSPADQKADGELRYALRLARGLLEIQSDKWSEATADLQRAIALDGQRVEAYALLAQVYLRQKHPEPHKAYEQYTRAIELRKEWAQFYRGRAGVYFGRPDQASLVLNDLDKAIGIELKQVKQPGTQPNPVVVADYTNKARTLLARGQSLSRKKKMPAAKEDFRQSLEAAENALEIRNDSLDAHAVRVAVLLELRCYCEVLSSCDELLASKRRPSAQLYELRSVARAKTNDAPGAIDDLNHALALLQYAPGAIEDLKTPADERSKTADLLIRRGSLFVILNAPQLALRDFEDAIAINEKEVQNPEKVSVAHHHEKDAHAYVGRGLARVLLGNYEEAISDANKVLDSPELTPGLMYNAARVYARSAIVAATKIRKEGAPAATRVKDYEDRAVALICNVLRQLPPDEHRPIWNDVNSDPSLVPLRRRIIPEGSAVAETSKTKPRGDSAKAAVKRAAAPTKPSGTSGK